MRWGRMRRRTLLLLGCAALAAAWIDLRLTGIGDYVYDAGPDVNALAAGRTGDFLHLQPIMGPLTILLRAPLVAVAHALGAGPLASYKVGTYPCVLSAGLLGAWLGRSVAWPFGLMAVVLASATPTIVSAASSGHPEEIVCAVLCVAAVLVARRQLPYHAALVLGLAVATKQWAVLAAPAVFVALEKNRLRAMVASGGVAALLYAPWVIGDPEAFRSVSHEAAAARPRVKVGSWWRLFVGHQLPGWLSGRTHAAIIGAAVLFAAAAQRRVRRPDALALLALFFLIRCVLDQSNDYYKQVPLVLALLAWETDTRRRVIPYATTYAIVWLILTFSYLSAPERVVSGAYFAGSAVLLVYLAYNTLSLRAQRHIPALRPGATERRGDQRTPTVAVSE